MARIIGLIIVLSTWIGLFCLLVFGNKKIIPGAEAREHQTLELIDTLCMNLTGPLDDIELYFRDIKVTVKLEPVIVPELEDDFECEPWMK